MEEVELPMKTKIAAWWMIISGILIAFFSIWWPWRLCTLPLATYSVPGYGCPPLSSYFPYLILGLFLIILGIFLLKKKKWAWVIIVILYSIFCIIGVIWLYVNLTAEPGPFGVRETATDPLTFLIVCGLSLILLLLDRKNFWKIAT